ncbi:hypothetical protein EYF80_052087 [Liparis tanakae]|uniref:Uncharacterized protein n=1 Tax=Liparis tanakae TaxID=230148 RepID=A0A4Z2F938_9TELE|nr:hypothetical protein EYF80_052087 [Liparis tanakae]
MGEYSTGKAFPAWESTARPGNALRSVFRENRGGATALLVYCIQAVNKEHKADEAILVMSTGEQRCMSAVVQERLAKDCR